MDKEKIISLRMERQFLTQKANEDEYIQLYRDMQPGQNVYWNGFGDPPSLTFRADFNDIEFNRERQLKRELIKGRFAGGNLGWIVPDDLELFAAMYIKQLNNPTQKQLQILELIEHEGPLNIQQIKQETGLLVKEITPVLQRLQEAFLIYEDQYDGEWDRGWYKFSEVFPDTNLPNTFLASDKMAIYTLHAALKIILQRFAYRHVLFDTAMAKSFYKLPEKEIKAAVAELVCDGVFTKANDGYMLKSDFQLLQNEETPNCGISHKYKVFAMHRNDFLYKSNEHILKEQFKPLYENLEYDHEPLQYLLIDGEFHGACIGHFRNGPYDLNDIVCDLPNAEEHKDEIIEAITAVNYGKLPNRFMGKEL